MHLVSPVFSNTQFKEQIQNKKERGEIKRTTLSIQISTVIYSTWLDLPGVITPADIAHGFIESRKPPHPEKD
jgi:hypothetical protein